MYDRIFPLFLFKKLKALYYISFKFPVGGEDKQKKSREHSESKNFQINRMGNPYKDESDAGIASSWRMGGIGGEVRLGNRSLPFLLRTDTTSGLRADQVEGIYC